MRRGLALSSVVLLVLLAISGAHAAGSNTGTGGSATPSAESAVAPEAVSPSMIVTLPVPGTTAPPATLGTFPMTPVPKPASGPVAPACTRAVPPLPTPGGPLGVAPTDAASIQRCIGSGWATWSHTYAGDVYYTGGAINQTLTMPPNTGAFYFYVEPNPFAVHNCSAIATSSTGTASTGGFPVDGDHGARMVGFHDPAGIISKIDVSCSADFATGEYGWAPGGAPPAGLVCDIQVNKTTSTVGVQIQVKNPGTTPVPAEFKIFVVLPSGPPASFLRTELTLLPGFDTGVLPLVSFPTSGLPAGPYEFNCRIVNPTTGAQLVFDQNPFTLP